MFRMSRSLLKYVRPIFTAKRLNYATEASKPQEKNPAPIPPPTMAEPPSSKITANVDLSPKTISKPDSNVESSNIYVKVEELEPIPEIIALHRSLPFDEVPGPKLLRQIAKFWSFFPLVGTEVTTSAIQYYLSAGSQLSWNSNLWLFTRLLDEYGPIVRLNGPFGGDVVILSRPEHASAIFANEGRFPIRSSLDCIEKYRLQFRRYKQAGPFLMYGPEWEALRKVLEPCLQNCIKQQYKEIEKSCDDLVTRIKCIRNRQDEVPPNFRNELSKWAMECMCLVTLNKNLGFLDPNGLNTSAEPARLLVGLNGATEAIRRCESGLHLWRFFETPAWKDLVKHCDAIDNILSKYIQKAQHSLQRKKAENVEISTENISVLESLLIRDGMLPEDALTVLLDLMLIGVNMTSHSAGFLIYNLAKNPRAQKKLYNELKSLPTNVHIEDLLNMKYLQACIKESLRLNPPMPILNRVLSKDVVVHNYLIPKGTYVLIATQLSSLREEHFEDASKFKPDRWLEPDVLSDENAFASLPYGHGPKACLAREVANMEMCLLTAKLLRSFRIEYFYGEIRSTNRLLAGPDRPLKFRFVDRV